MKVGVFTLGCKVNQYESQSIMEAIRQMGHDALDSFSYADIYIINTCSITAEADKKSRQMIARVLKCNPKAKVAVLGCSSQNDGTKYAAKENVVFVGGTSGKLQAIQHIMSDAVRAKAYMVSGLPLQYEDDMIPMRTKSRAYIKVQDGCDSFCSYCVVPYLRGRSRSRPIGSIVSEAHTFEAQTREIVLTGINVSHYGHDIGSKLIELVQAMKPISARKRFSSLECSVVDDDLLSAMQESGFCAHFHLSLQSGSDAVLQKMNRHYSVRAYLEKVERIRHYFPDAGVTTDVIAGFPYEEERHHAETLAFLETVRFSDIHVFPYSEREGTVACRYPQLDRKIRIRRAAEIAAVRDDLKHAFWLSQLGKVKDVFLEEQQGAFSVGYTDNYIKVFSSAPVHSLLPHRLKEIVADQGIKGEIDG